MGLRLYSNDKRFTVTDTQSVKSSWFLPVCNTTEFEEIIKTKTGKLYC